MEPSLAEVQRLLLELIVAPEGVEAALAQACPGLRHELERVVEADSRLSAVERLDIYANMYFFRLLECLKEDFPTLAAIVGSDHFHNLITGYLLAYPPTQPAIQHAGRHLHEYLADHSLLGEFPWIADLARLERTQFEVFHAEDCAPLQAAALAAIPPERWASIVTEPVPSFALLDFRWDVATPRQAWDRGEPPCPPAHRPTTVLVWRKVGRVLYRQVEGAELTLLRRVAAGGSSFGQLCELIVEQIGEERAVAMAVELLQRWLADELLRPL